MKRNPFWKHRLEFVVVYAAAFAVLDYLGTETIRKAPPHTKQIVSIAGSPDFTGNEVLTGQAVWQSIKMPTR